MNQTVLEKTSTLVEIRLFREHDESIPWHEKEPEAFLPRYLSGESDKENIQKRLKKIYFKNESDIYRVRWNFRGSKDGYWLVKSQEYKKA